MSKTKGPTFEKRFELLQAILKEMDSPDTPLERMLKLYEEGIEAIQEAAGELSAIEARVRLLKEKADGIFETVEYTITTERDR